MLGEIFTSADEIATEISAVKQVHDKTEFAEEITRRQLERIGIVSLSMESTVAVTFANHRALSCAGVDSTSELQAVLVEVLPKISLIKPTVESQSVGQAPAILLAQI